VTHVPIFPVLVLTLAAMFCAAPARMDAADGGAFVRACAWTETGDDAVNGKRFEAQLDGAPAKVLRVQGPGDDLIVLIVMDVAGDLALIDEARTALDAEIRGLPPNAWTGLLRGQEGLKALVDPTPDREKVITSLKAIPISGRASLLSTIENAGQIATSIVEKAPVRVAVLYVTDSNIYNYREDYTNPVVNRSDSGDLSRRFPDGLIREEISRISNNLGSAKAPVFIVHLELNRQRLNEAYQNGLLQLAETTGG
jgi:hypothetical protein